ncbi:bifunctional phosphoglucose/phosphomannose isomerase [bacterium]|nr:bifunctional phosphoglucose/phosphomannose isomerase [bacterium]
MIDLDDLKTIKEKDKSNMLQILLDFPQQWKEAKEIAQQFSFPQYKRISKIVVTGLGGSAIGGDLLCSYLADEIKIPVFVNRNYSLPGFVDEEALLFAVSYSGNTEETISAYQKAIERRAKVIAVTSGGKLRDLCESGGVPSIIIPSGMPPRTAIGYLFLPMLIALAETGLIEDKTREIEETNSLLVELRKGWEPSSQLSRNQAKELAQRLPGKLILIYGSDHLEAVCLRWKTQVNENSKSLAYPVAFPELNHNEIVGWEGMEELRRKIEVIILRDKGEPDRIKSRIEITKSVIGDRPSEVKEVWSQGQSLLARMFSLIYLGDWVSFYLAILQGVDPTVIRPIDLLKKKLAEV